ncbi:MAG TPA: hypothetical protein VEK39_06610 [Solirubrobacterales bacterium]|nr:hypothetical protein [Solirubrobacterales bacterium]
MPASITTWSRLEPLDQSTDLDASLSAPIADPLWLLHRQWQLGELEANDAGSPIAVTVTRAEAALSGFRAADPRGTTGTRRAYDPAAMPLEPLIEAERVRGLAGAHRRLAAETGAHWLRLLKARGFPQLIAAYRAAFPIQLAASVVPEADPLGAEAAILLGGRAIDGDLLAAQLRAARGPQGRITTLPASFPPGPAGVLAVAVEWLHWYDELLVEPDGVHATPPAWQTRRFEYRFSAAARVGAKEATFGSVAYDDGHLDWPDLSAGHRRLGVPAATPATAVDVVIPVPLSYPGMPAHRHWEIEDSQVSFAGIEAGSTDVVRMLLTDFALVYGDDWFIVPFSATVGSLVTIQKVTVRDTFGVTTQVPPAAATAGARRWAMYAFTASPAAATTAALPGPDSLLIPPALPAVLSGSPVEEAAFFRDEQANLVWAVERTTTSPLGTPVDRYRYSRPATRVTVDVTDIGDADLVYRLTTPIPGNWYPYLPKPTPAGDDLTLNRLPASTPEGQIVTESAVVEDEEVSRGGLVVERTWQFARWTGGQPVLWLGRRVTGGRGEGFSGQTWDFTEPPPSTA